MSGIKCKCGNYYSTGGDPNPHGAFVIAESRFYEIDADTIDKWQFYKLFGSESERMYKCPYCKRLAISGSDKSYTDWDFYKLDDS